jgi:hypothetical protein
MPTVAINGTFYSLQSPKSFAAWNAATPETFVFSVKGPRYLTHVLRLKLFEAPLANFLASGLFNLGHKLGPLLWQLPPNLRFNADRIETFLAALPHDTEAALAIARRRDSRMTGRARLAIDARRPMRHAIEIRHDSFLDPQFIALLRRYWIALVVADTAENGRRRGTSRPTSFICGCMAQRSSTGVGTAKQCSSAGHNGSSSGVPAVARSTPKSSSTMLSRHCSQGTFTATSTIPTSARARQRPSIARNGQRIEQH